MMRDTRSLPASILSACVLGLVLCPLPYIILAARAELSPVAVVMVALPFALGAGILLAHSHRSSGLLMSIRRVLRKRN
jgi:hypothetical protein